MLHDCEGGASQTGCGRCSREFARGEIMGSNGSGGVNAATMEFLSSDHRLLIGGDWVRAQSGESIPVVNPATEEVIARVAAAGPADVDRAVTAARCAVESGPWPSLSPTARGALLWALADALEANREVLTEIEVLNNGMPLNPGGSLAVPGAARTLRYYAGWPSKITGHTVPGDPRAGADRAPFTYTRREPVGVVGQIIPWNYPLGMTAMKLGPALAAGCTVVLKPDEKTPLSALFLGELIRKVGFPPGVVNIVPGYGERAGAAIAAHPDIDKVAFTGSTEVGRKILQAAAGNLKKVSLELGGKSPFIVFPDADLDKVIEAATRSAFFLQGQNCQCASRLLIHEKVRDRVVNGLVKAASGMKIGPGWDPATRIGPLISAEHLGRVQEYVASGVAEGAQLLTGGDRLPGRGFFMPPTVFGGASRDMRIVREEIFGPVTCVQSFGDSDLDDIARQANDTIYGLVASVWTRDLRIAHRLAESIKAGVVGINQHGSPNIFAPFGGYKQSGWGREFGAESLDLYLETKTVVMKSD
jgi:acyl-CoA reductase-like NAD-dependent aldehyde dehydrogenase